MWDTYTETVQWRTRLRCGFAQDEWIIYWASDSNHILFTYEALQFLNNVTCLAFGSVLVFQEHTFYFNIFEHLSANRQQVLSLSLMENTGCWGSLICVSYFGVRRQRLLLTGLLKAFLGNAMQSGRGQISHDFWILLGHTLLPVVTQTAEKLGPRSGKGQTIIFFQSLLCCAHPDIPVQVSAFIPSASCYGCP